MSTAYQEIYSRFANKVQDYKLDQLYSSSVVNYEKFLKGLLINAIEHFTECVQDLSDRDDSTQTFNITLTSAEQNILALFLEYEWMSRQVNNILEMELAFSSNDFRRYAESQNLKEKANNRDTIFENATNTMISYSYKNKTWS